MPRGRTLLTGIDGPDAGLIHDVAIVLATMDPVRRYTVTNAVLFVLALGNGLLTWPPADVAVQVAGGAAIAFVLEAAGVWHYPEHRLSAVRFRGIPLWNFGVWLVVVFVTAMLPTIVG